MSTTAVSLNQPVIATGEARTFFFNGRLLSAEDLQREQGQRETGQRRLAQLIGCGIATGLDVTANIGSSTLSITAGLGVTPSGEVIAVDSFDLQLKAAATQTVSGRFSACDASASSGSLLAGQYLLVLTPTWISDGRAPTLLGDVGACNRNVERPAVRARLLKLKTPDGATDTTLRNLLAVALLAPEPLPTPTPGAPPILIGWWPTKFAPTLGLDDLPIAVVSINAQAQVVFLDVHAAQRRLAPSPGNAADALWPESCAVEMEAFALQFSDQTSKLDTNASAEAFVWLPPVLVLNKQAKLNYGQVFGNLPKEHKVGREGFARALRDSLNGEPIERANGIRSVLLRLGDSERWLLRLRPARKPSTPK